MYDVVGMFRGGDPEVLADSESIVVAQKLVEIYAAMFGSEWIVSLSYKSHDEGAKS
jgi:hypothetical protein